MKWMTKVREFQMCGSDLGESIEKVLIFVRDGLTKDVYLSIKVTDERVMAQSKRTSKLGDSWGCDISRTGFKYAGKSDKEIEAGMIKVVNFLKKWAPHQKEPLKTYRMPRQTVVKRDPDVSIPDDFEWDVYKAMQDAGAWSAYEQSPYKAFRIYLAENIEPGSYEDSTHMLVIGELRDDADGGQLAGLQLKGDKIWGHIDVRGWKAKEGAA